MTNFINYSDLKLDMAYQISVLTGAECIWAIPLLSGGWIMCKGNHTLNPNTDDLYHRVQVMYVETHHDFPFIN